MNNVSLVGRLTRDVDLRWSKDIAVARFAIAVDRPRKKNGDDGGTDFPNIVVFGKQAENCEKYIGKGRLVGIEGRIQTGSYTNKNGATVYTTEVVAGRVSFLDHADHQNTEQQNTSVQPQTAQQAFSQEQAQPSFIQQPPQQQSFNGTMHGQGFEEINEDVAW